MGRELHLLHHLHLVPAGPPEHPQKQSQTYLDSRTRTAFLESRLIRRDPVPPQGGIVFGERAETRGAQRVAVDDIAVVVSDQLRHVPASPPVPRDRHEALGERAHRSLALIALLMWGIAGLLPFTRNDLHGGSVLVFVYWFVLLSYYRWYMERISAATCWKLILAGLGIEVVYCLAFSLVFAMTGKGAGFQFFIFDNWKIPSMFIGFGLFELFARREFHSRCVNCLAGSAFGVYLVHYHPAVKTLWMNWLPLDKLYLSAHPLAAMTVCVLAIFACCLALDLVRQGLFAMTVDRNRGRWFELVWNKATERTKPMPVHTVPVHTEK